MLDKGKMRKGGLLTYLLPEREEDVYRPLRPLFLSLFLQVDGGRESRNFHLGFFFLILSNWVELDGC